MWPVLFLLVTGVIGRPEPTSSEKFFEFVIDKQWDSSSTGHDPITIQLVKDVSGPTKSVRFIVDAPFFNDPDAPDGPAGEPFDKLWDYEVVEAFFLNDDGRYLEVEVCPHGQHLLLLLDGARNAIKMKLPMQFESEVNCGENWHGEAVIPEEYFPPQVSKFNAYAIHGSESRRMYEALYPTPLGEYTYPDFHRLEYFQDIDFKVVLPGNQSPQLSEVWKEALGETS